ncbi:MAG: polymerase sigma factor [Ramlibacter sp.]|nr:polymerase sigma factor [Ramlibacter sp.]
MTALAYATATPLTFVLAFQRSMQEPVLDPPGAAEVRDRQWAALLAAAAGGDARAFESFYSGTVRYAMAVVRRVAGGTHAEDILADCYFQAWRNAAQFDAQRGSALGWLLSMARSRALDRMRQEMVRHGGLAGAPAFDADNTEATPDPGPDALLESLQSSSRLHGALAQLSANERWVLGLAFFRDHTQSEIAALTGLPLGTVKSLINRAQHKLRETLQ